MDFGIVCLASVASRAQVAFAEASGFTHAWLADSQMVWADVFQCLALAANDTRSDQNRHQRDQPEFPNCSGDRVQLCHAQRTRTGPRDHGYRYGQYLSTHAWHARPPNSLSCVPMWKYVEDFGIARPCHIRKVIDGGKSGSSIQMPD